MATYESAYITRTIHMTGSVNLEQSNKQRSTDDEAGRRPHTFRLCRLRSRGAAAGAADGGSEHAAGAAAGASIGAVAVAAAGA